MEHKRRNTAKLATLDAASKMYFILAALAIRQAFFPSSNISSPGNELQAAGILAKLFLVGGYILTVMRFSHGISLLHGKVKASVEQSELHTAFRVAWISFFLVSLGVVLLFVGDRITHFRIFLLGFVLLMILDFILIGITIRFPVSKVGLLAAHRPGDPLADKKTAVPLLLIVATLRRRSGDSSPLSAQIQWLASDVLLAVLCVLFIIWDWVAGRYTVTVGVPSWFVPLRFLFFGIVLFAFAYWDYRSNRHFYFGGKVEFKKGLSSV